MVMQRVEQTAIVAVNEVGAEEALVFPEREAEEIAHAACQHPEEKKTQRPQVQAPFR